MPIEIHLLRSVFLALTILLSGIGCTRDVYELELRPDGDSIERTLTVWCETTRSNGNEKASPLAAKDLSRIRQFYDVQNDLVENDRHTFAGRFQDNMPGDIGGAGYYRHFESPLGATFVYSERFRGNDDLKQSMQTRLDAVNKIVGLLLHWVHEEFKDATVHDQLAELLDQEIRRDLENFSLLCWTYGMSNNLNDEQEGKNFSARAAQYLVERDYCSLTDLPRIFRVVQSENEQELAKLLLDTVLRKLELSSAAPAASELAILGDAERLAISLRASVLTSEIFKIALVEHQRSRKSTNDVEGKSDNDDALGVFAMLAIQATLPHLFDGRVGVRVMLHCENEPFASNGTWASDKNVVTWKDSIDNGDLPMLAFAAWSSPNTDAQQQHFGRVVLEGEELATFVLAYRGMNAGEMSQFDEFLATLLSNDNSLKKCTSLSVGDDEKLDASLRSILKAAVLKSKLKIES